jgi:hypothetical protein
VSASHPVHIGKQRLAASGEERMFAGHKKPPGRGNHMFIPALYTGPIIHWLLCRVLTISWYSGIFAK